MQLGKREFVAPFVLVLKFPSFASFQLVGPYADRKTVANASVKAKRRAASIPFVQAPELHGLARGAVARLDIGKASLNLGWNACFRA